MQGRAFLDLAREIILGDSEVHRRGAVGRAYYALMLECRNALFRWGFKLPPRDNVHSFVRLRFMYASDPDLRVIGLRLENLVKLRNQADYQLTLVANFRTNATAQQAIDDAAHAIALLDAIDAYPARQAAAVAAIRKAFP